MYKLPLYFLCSFCAFFTFSTTSLANSLMSIAPAQASEYIEQFKSIAEREMWRSGIPVSITLAQGIHESAAGTSSLPVNANNHFGIKCKGSWKGDTYYLEDDDFKNGKLIKSCFRVYANAEDSYIDHTDFLLNNPRYAPLFKLSSTDYKGWAKGLKKCGYATDKKYAQKLISIIERYQLHAYDNPPMAEAPMVEAALETVEDAFALLLEMEGLTATEEVVVAEEVLTTVADETAAVVAAVILPNADVTQATEDVFVQSPVAPQVATNDTNLPDDSTPAPAPMNHQAAPPAMLLSDNYQRNTQRATEYEAPPISTQPIEQTTYTEETSIDEPAPAHTEQDADFAPAQELFIPKQSLMKAPAYNLSGATRNQLREKGGTKMPQRRPQASYSRRR